jgi:hypothetical protein
MLLAISLGGCSGFERDWQRALDEGIPQNTIEGPWEGRWLTEAEHSGGLRCLVKRLDDGSYQMRFHATFWKIFSAGYSVRMTGEEKDGVLHLVGEHDLGWLGGGLYKYEARISDAEYIAEYRSKRNNGTFTLRRPKIEARAAPP